LILNQSTYVSAELTTVAN